MQSFTSLSRALYRIVFRGGTPQRIHFSTTLLLLALVVFVAAGVMAQRWLFNSGILEAGLFVFTWLTGGYIGAALLTRKVPRNRLRLTIQSILLLLAASQLILLAAAGLVVMAPAAGTAIVWCAAIGVSAALIIGMSNCLRFATGDGQSAALITSITFLGALAVFYALMAALLKTLYS